MGHLGPRQSLNTEASTDAATATQVATISTSESLPTSNDVNTATSPLSVSPSQSLIRSVPATDTTIPVSTLPTATGPSNVLSPSTVGPSQSLSSSFLSTTGDPTTTTSLTTSAPESSTTSQPSSSVSPTSESSSSPSASSTPSPTSTSSSSSSTSSNVQTSSTSPLTSPISSGSTLLQGTPTTITSSFTILVNGSPAITQTLIPSTINQPPHSTTSDRTAIIAGSAAGGAVLIILVVSIIFYSRRKHFKRLNFINAIISRRKQARSRAMLLAGEDMDDVELYRPPPGQFYDYGTPWDGSDLYGSSTFVGRGMPPRIPSRTSDTGSIFREDVWPPPNESSRLMSDPLAQAASIDLSKIVDDVMGPSSTAAHFSQQSITSSHREPSGYVSDRDLGDLHSRDWSIGSQVSLLQAGGSVGAAPNQPSRSSPLAQRVTTDSGVHEKNSTP